jgi:L-ascorbate metabolism protein UlaG (beta-lactamase superfamily)
MRPRPLTLQYIGGPTVLLDWGGVRLLTDPGFDPPGEYTSGPVVLRKTAGPALRPEALGHVDAVLLSHDHHPDNLDHSGRAFLATVGRVFTTPAGAGRLGGHAVGLAAWQSLDMPAPDGRVLRVTGTPARHGPAHLDRGPVTGFALAFADAPDHALYVSGDTVWYDGSAEVARRFDVRTAVLFLGAARVPAVGTSEPLTMTAADGIAAARAFPKAIIVPVHYEGWAHFSESRDAIARAFAAAGIGSRIRWMELGKTMTVA